MFKNKKSKKGSAIVLVMFAVLILFLAGFSLLRMGLNSRIFAIRDAEKIQAKNAADAGLTKAIYEMNQKLLEKPWDGSTLPYAVNSQLENTNSTYSFSVTGDMSGGYSIESTGSCGQAQRTVRATLRLEGPFEFAIFAEDSISLKNGSIIDWYNNDADDDSLQVGTNSIGSADVALKNSAVINGDVLVGPGGNPSAVIDNKGTITGKEDNLPHRNELRSVTVPSDIAAKASGGTISNNTTLTAGRYKYTSINLGNNKILTIDGAVVLYVTGNSSFGNSASVNINNNSSLVLYAGGNFDGKNGAGFNNQNSSKVPKQLQIYGLDTCTSMDFKNNSELYGTIYAPKASVVFHNGIPTYGAVVANTFEQKYTADFHYDASLRDVNYTDELINFVINRWSED